MQYVTQAFAVICAEILFWLRHQKLDWPENFWCNFRNWGGKLPPWLRAWCRGGEPIYCPGPQI